MSTAKAITDQDVQVAITLASISYLAENESRECMTKAMRTALQPGYLPTAGKWELRWGPYEHETNLWYVAVGPNARGAQTAAIVIRGTLMTSLKSLEQDAEVTLVPIPWTNRAPTGAMVAQGFADAFNRLMDPRTLWPNALQFVKTLGPGIGIDVVGHSLGGALAPMMALCVKSAFPGQVVRSFPFGGQTPGNAAFEQWYTDEFAGQHSRWINRLDVIPMFFGELDRVMNTFGKPGPPCPRYVKSVLDALKLLVGKSYVPARNPAEFEGQLYPQVGLFAWEEEASAQHSHFYYMYLAGVAESVIRKHFAPCWSPPRGACD